MYIYPSKLFYNQYFESWLYSFYPQLSLYVCIHTLNFLSSDTVRMNKYMCIYTLVIVKSKVYI